MPELIRRASHLKFVTAIDRKLTTRERHLLLALAILVSANIGIVFCVVTFFSLLYGR